MCHSIFQHVFRVPVKTFECSPVVIITGDGIGVTVREKDGIDNLDFVLASKSVNQTGRRRHCLVERRGAAELRHRWHFLGPFSVRHQSKQVHTGVEKLLMRHAGRQVVGQRQLVVKFKSFRFFDESIRSADGKRIDFEGDVRLPAEHAQYHQLLKGSGHNVRHRSRPVHDKDQTMMFAFGDD